MAKLVLHIGTPKTGSTYLQAWLRRNVEGLREQGWSYPSFVAGANHRTLAMAFDPNISPAHVVAGIDTPEAVARTKRDWADGLSANVTPDSQWIITSEFFARRFVDKAPVQAVIDFLRGWFDEIVVVAYIRRQEYMLPSIYSQDVKGGRRWDWSWEYCQERFPPIEYNHVYDLWNQTDGVDEVRLVPFLEANKKDPRQVLNQFTELTGIEFRSDWMEPPAIKSNPSLSVEGIAFLWAINPHLPRLTSTGDSNKVFRALVIKQILELTPGPNFNPADDVIEQVHSHFLESNRALVDRLPPSPDWEEWLEQPTTNGKPQALVAELTAARTAELIIALSEPHGPIAWGEEDKRPVPPLPYREVAVQRVGNRLKRLAKRP